MDNFHSDWKGRVQLKKKVRALTDIPLEITVTGTIWKWQFQAFVL
ncbi:hypothetical protein HOLDEFILI_01670 [Holdemania filiformis DSM 12042]|uniref:Uncharacterized protein n=1 Tax=Holdemania filiformis DSM 12042 TaxID=545696 RepID=B9Y776_9FIRM|nr:hypothetical protein HOLDEFILI_01670 [Holdemania filiformis DSM 12042]